MEKKPVANAGELARQLQERLRRERPRWLRWAPLLAMFLLGVLALTAWVMVPAPDPPRVTVTALDALIVKGQAVDVQAYFDPENPELKGGSLARLQATIGSNQTELPPGTKLQPTSLSDDHGRLTAKLDIGEAARAVFFVRQTLPIKHQAPQRDLGSIYVVPADAPLLLVDAEETLADLDPQLWSKTNALEITVRAGAAEALHAAQKKNHMTVVYFAVGLTPAREYRRVRDWVGLKAAGKDRLPEGPVLGRLQYDGGAASAARKELLGDLRKRFTGPIVAVVRGADAAEQCLELGIRAVAMGAGDFPAGTAPIKSWQELPAILAR